MDEDDDDEEEEEEEDFFFISSLLCWRITLSPSSSFLLLRLSHCQCFLQPISCVRMREVGRGVRLIKALESQEKKRTALIQLYMSENRHSKQTLQWKKVEHEITSVSFISYSLHKRLLETLRKGAFELGSAALILVDPPSLNAPGSLWVQHPLWRSWMSSCVWRGACGGGDRFFAFTLKQQV